MKLKTPYKDLLDPLATEEREALAADIKVHGVLHPIIVDEDGNILDGHHRYAIRKDAPVRVLEGLSENEKRAFVLSSNNKRRNLSPEQKAALRKTMINTAKALKEEDPKRWTQSRIAAALGVDRASVSRWLDISNVQTHKANTDARVSVPKQKRTEIVERLDAGEAQSQVAADYGVSQGRVAQIAKQERQRKENEAKVESIAAQEVKGTFDNLYDVLVIDPPWPMEKIDRDCRPNQSAFDYPTMSEDELAEMKLPCKANAHVWVWTTHKFLPMTLRLLDAWGLKYVCTFVWHKPGGFQPIGLPQYNCEFAVYCRKGSPKFVDTKAFNACFQAPRTKHSEKPESFYDVLRRVTDGSRIDIFNRREIKGFDSWGNEA